MIFEVHEPTVQSGRPLAQIDPVDKNVSQILSASAPVYSQNVSHSVFFYPAAYFHKVWVCGFLQIDAVAQNVLQILYAPFQRRCTLKMCQIPYSLAYLPLLTTLYEGILLENPLSFFKGSHNIWFGHPPKK